MPRLTNHSYLLFHVGLRDAWLNHQELYGFVSPRNQWHLHDYFCPSRELTPTQLLEHRERITKHRPPLPQQAGRALALFVRAANELQTAPGAVTHHDQLRNYGVVEPEFDIDVMVTASQLIVEQQRRNQHDADSDHRAAS